MREREGERGQERETERYRATERGQSSPITRREPVVCEMGCQGDVLTSRRCCHLRERSGDVRLTHDWTEVILSAEASFNGPCKALIISPDKRHCFMVDIYSH